MLIIFGGLPGSGKSTIARELARRIGAVHLRIDSIEQAFISSGIAGEDIGPAGYIAAYTVARDNLIVGRTVVADSVNPIEITRTDWREVALKNSSRFVEVELVCTNRAEHQNRVETRAADIPGHRLPTWSEVVEREYEEWDSQDLLVIDTSSKSVEESVAEICRYLESRSLSASLEGSH